MDPHGVTGDEMHMTDGAGLVPGGFNVAQEVVGEGEPLSLRNEFAEVVVRKVRTRNGVRLEICSPGLGYAIRLCPLQLEALTWQSSEVFSGFLMEQPGPAGDSTQT
jgi:hypothetical protein